MRRQVLDVDIEGQRALVFPGVEKSKCVVGKSLLLEKKMCFDLQMFTCSNCIDHSISCVLNRIQLKMNLEINMKIHTFNIFDDRTLMRTLGLVWIFYGENIGK